MFQSIVQFFCGSKSVSQSSWLADKRKLINGVSDKKYYPENITKWYPVKGTPKEIKKEISKYPKLYKLLEDAKNDPIALRIATANISHHANVVTCEWHSFYMQKKLDPKWIDNERLQECADLAYNNWRDFQAVIFELLYKNFRSEENSYNAVKLFIEDQNTALKILLELYPEN